MQIKPFALERYFAEHEFTARYLLSASDCESLTLPQLLALADEETAALWGNLGLGYTESQGHPLLREAIAGQYRACGAENVLVAAPEEAIFIAMNALLSPGDHLMVTWPAYQSLYEVAAALDCRVTRWPLRPRGAGWVLDMDELRDQVTSRTRLIVINLPHNPTGHLITQAALGEIMAIAGACGAWVFSDEMYRGLEYGASQQLPAACDLYERGISLAGLSKAHGLPGLRIGWLAMGDRTLLARCAALKDYTTICSSAPSEILGLIALRSQERIVARNLDIIRANLAVAERFFAGHDALFTWMPPRAGSVAFPRLREDLPVSRFCQELLAEESIMVLPGAMFETEGNHFRVGLGRANLPEALARLETHLRR